MSDVRPGATIASLRLLERIAEGDRIQCWKGSWPDGSDGTAHVLRHNARPRERENFLSAARRLASAARARPLSGVAGIAAVAPSELAYVTRVSATGTMADVPALKWRIQQTVGFLTQLCRGMRELHLAGLVHGCARPANVLMDGDLRPVLSDAGMLRLDDSYEGSSSMRHDYAAYSAREVRIGHPADVRSDIFSLGRLMYYAIHAEEPDEADEDLPLLAALGYAPPGLVRIIRRATLRDPQRRYPSVDQLLADLERYQNAPVVGLGHPHGPDGEAVAAELPAGEGLPAERPSLRSLTDDDGPSWTGRHRAVEPTPRPAPTPRPSESSRPTRSSRPPAPAAAPRRRPPRPAADTLYDPDEDLLTPRQARGAAIAGAVLLFAAAGYGFAAGEPSTAAAGIAVLGAVLLSLWVPAIGRSPLVSRGLSAIVVGVMVWVLDPVGGAAFWGRVSRLTGGSPGERATRIHDEYLGGERDFGGLSLEGTDFRALDLSGARFEGSDLRGSNFAGAVVAGSSFAEARVEGCDFSGADLTGVDTSPMNGWPETRCDGASVMPGGWRCTEGRPTPAVGVTMTGVAAEPPPE